MKTVIGFVAMIVACYPLQEGNTWKRFVQNPTEKAFHDCKMMMASDLFSDAEVDSTATLRCLSEQGVISGFTRLLIGGNILAAELSFDLIRLLRGRPDIVEELKISIGRFFESNPEGFAKLLETYTGPHKDKRLSCLGLLGSLGEEFTDHPSGIISELKRRVEILKKTRLRSQLKQECIEELEEEIADLERILENEGHVKAKN